MHNSDQRSSMGFLLVGVGGSGCSAVETAAARAPRLPYLLIDTDARSAGSDEHYFSIGKNVTNGLSAGGGIELGRPSIEKDSARLRARFESVDIIVIVVGLGGGTGTGAVPVLTRIAREADAQTMVLASLPFAFEGKQRRKMAEAAIKRLRSHTDAIVQLPNERLKREAKSDRAEDAFLISHRYMADAAVALWRICLAEGHCGLDFASIHTLLRACDGFCHIASVEADGEDRVSHVTKALIAHPLMNRGLLWEGAAGIVLSIQGDESLTLQEVESVMEQLTDKAPDEARINFGVYADRNQRGISLIALVTEEWKEPLVDAEVSIFSGQSGRGQGELPLGSSGGKGLFHGMDGTVVNQEDLDVPTYIRKKIKLPR